MYNSKYYASKCSHDEQNYICGSDFKIARSYLVVDRLVSPILKKFNSNIIYISEKKSTVLLLTAGIVISTHFHLPTVILNEIYVGIYVCMYA